MALLQLYRWPDITNNNNNNTPQPEISEISQLCLATNFPLSVVLLELVTSQCYSFIELFYYDKIYTEFSNRIVT